MAADEVTADEFDEFTPFPKLPMELQLKIWKLAIPGPRVIKVKVLAPNTIYDPEYVIPQDVTGTTAMQPFRANSFLQDPERNRLEMEKAARGIALSTNTKSPGVLFACQNSRSEALKHYTRCFDLNGGKKTRFDPTGDTVLISHTAKLFLPPLPHVVGQPDLCPDFGSLFPGAEMLALSGFDVAVGGIEEIESLLSQFTSLKTLVLVLNIPSKQPLDYLIQSDDELRYQTIEERVAEFPERVKKLQHSSTELISNEAVFRSSSSR